MDEELCNVCGQPDNCGDCTHVLVDDPRLSLWYTGTVDGDGIDHWYRWWAENKAHAIEQSEAAWTDEVTVFAFKA